MPDDFTRTLTADQIDDTADAPLYQQIYSLLREQIVSGAIPTNTRLPAEHELTERLGVSRITVKRAMNELAQSGLVRRHRGRGTVVVFDAATPTVKGSFENLIDGLTRMGVDTDVSLLSCETIRADAAQAEIFDLPTGASLRHIKRLRTMEGEPFSHLETTLPMDVASGFSTDDLATASLISLLERAGFAPRQAEQTITATAAPPEIANLLGIAAGAPLLRIHRIMRDADGRPVQDITAHYRADRFQYHMQLSRESSETWM